MIPLEDKRGLGEPDDFGRKRAGTPRPPYIPPTTFNRLYNKHKRLQAAQEYEDMLNFETDSEDEKEPASGSAGPGPRGDPAASAAERPRGSERKASSHRPKPAKNGFVLGRFGLAQCRPTGLTPACLRLFR